jgi:UDP-3-O-[3-hydroxymyristoyl] N-acetylglucosamine deacetylase
VIELDGPEVPAMDGSSRPFVTLIERAGVVRQNAARRVIKIHKPVTVCKDDAFAVLMPDNVARFTVQIDFRAPMIGFQRLSMDLRADSFKHEIADARTFGFAEQVGILRANGFALGGSLKNALVIDGDRLMNPEGVRSPDEFVRHKMLDCIGDLALAGTPILGHFFGYKPGHTLNSALLRELFVHEDSWSYTTFADALQIPAWRRLADARLADAMQLARSWWQKVA